MLLEATVIVVVAFDPEDVAFVTDVQRHRSADQLMFEAFIHFRKLVPVFEILGLRSLFMQRRYFAEQAGKKGFLSNLVDSIQDEIAKNKELEENLKKLQSETQKLEQSDALKKAREKYDLIERETLRSSEVLKYKLTELQQQMRKTLEEIKATELGRKGVEMGESAVKQAKEAVQSLEQSMETISRTDTYKMVAENVKIIKAEIDDIALSSAQVYQRPEKLRKRDEYVAAENFRILQPNTEATSLELHKESRWYDSWKSWAESSPYYAKLLDLKLRYDESDSRLVRSTRFFTDKIIEIFEGLFSRNNISEALTEICKVDPAFTLEEFKKFCVTDIIPNVLEASIRNDMDILKDWCNDVAFSQLTYAQKEYRKAGYIHEGRILDLGPVEVILGKMTDLGPILVVTFTSNQVRSVKTPDGNQVFGSSTDPVAISHVWALCRDLEQLNPRAAWKVMEAVETEAKRYF